MNFSPQQLAFFEELRTGSGSIILNAVAGAGKTTTIVEGARSCVPRHCSTVFLAFNKKIAEELEPRLPSHITASTFHSFCLRALTRSLPRRPKIEGGKTRELLKQNLSGKELALYGAFASRLVSYAKNVGIGIPSLVSDTEDNWFALVAHFSLTLDNLDADPQRAVEIAANTFRESVTLTDLIDFDDMLYLALQRRVRFDVSNFVFVDEAQDTNGVQRELLKLMGNFAEGGPSRLIAVGDPMQAIYGFRGADADALDLIQRDFNAKVLPLSVCYRCSQTVISEVHKHFPELKPTT